jgi:hypothetical protein
MNARHSTVALGLTAFGLALVLTGSEAPAQPAEVARSGSAAPPVQANATEQTSFEADPPGPEKSPVPTAKEWVDAASVKLTRRSPAASGCSARRVREWLRVRCPVKTFAISLLGGSNEGLAFWIGPEAEGWFGEVQFPLRRGDTRVVQLWGTKTGPAGVGELVPSLVLQEQWVEGEAAPMVSVL